MSESLRLPNFLPKICVCSTFAFCNSVKCINIELVEYTLLMTHVYHCSVTVYILVSLDNLAPRTAQCLCPNCLDLLPGFSAFELCDLEEVIALFCVLVPSWPHFFFSFLLLLERQRFYFIKTEMHNQISLH